MPSLPHTLTQCPRCGGPFGLAWRAADLPDSPDGAVTTQAPRYWCVRCRWWVDVIDAAPQSPRELAPPEPSR